jgi:hypothetical protein
MNAPKNPPEHPVLPDTRTLPLEKEISRHAYRLWQHYGCPRGRDVDIWLEAERQLLGLDPRVNQQPGGAVLAAPLGDVLYPPVQPAGPQPGPPTTEPTRVAT